jgi:hypothetical protein
MPARPNAPRFPHPETLADFFRMDRQSRVRVSRLAQLLDAPAGQVRHILHSEGVELREDSIEWGEAAACLLDAWPRARIIQVLGPSAGRFVPSAFHPERVRWAIPPYIIRAIEYQVALLRASDPRVNPGAPDLRYVSPSVDDYVADILFNEIQPATVARLARDPAFLAAYLFPPVE